MSRPRFEEGLTMLEAARKQRLENREQLVGEVLSPERRSGADLRPGERVRDTITGQEVEVLGTTFRRILLPPARRP